MLRANAHKIRANVGHSWISKFPQIQVLQSTDMIFKRDTKICAGFWTSALEYVNGFAKLRGDFRVAYSCVETAPMTCERNCSNNKMKGLL